MSWRTRKIKNPTNGYLAAATIRQYDTVESRGTFFALFSSSTTDTCFCCHQKIWNKIWTKKDAGEETNADDDHVNYRKLGKKKKSFLFFLHEHNATNPTRYKSGLNQVKVVNHFVIYCFFNIKKKTHCSLYLPFLW